MVENLPTVAALSRSRSTGRFQLRTDATIALDPNCLVPRLLVCVNHSDDPPFLIKEWAAGVPWIYALGLKNDELIR
jgi:hypothetical protein